MRFVLILLFAIVLIFFLLNSYGSTQTVVSLTGIHARVWGFIYIIILGVTRIRWHVTLPKQVITLSGVLGILSLLLGLFLGIWEYFTPDNYVFNLLRLQPFTLTFLGNVLLAIMIISLPKVLLKKWGRYMLWVLPLWFLTFSMWVRLLPFDKFVSFSTEDGFVEYSQFVTVFTAALLLFIEVGLSLKVNQLRKALIFTLLAGAFFFIAMEEISWGQRIFRFQTPSEISQVNVQNETTIHNIGVFNSLQYVGYITLCVIGTIGGLLHSIRKYKWNAWIPTLLPWYLLIPAIYYLAFLFNNGLHPYSELMELLFYGGLFLWVFPQLRLVQAGVS
jgi:hypothetical protein